MRFAVSEVGKRYPTAIVSGRSRDKVNCSSYTIIATIYDLELEYKLCLWDRFRSLEYSNTVYPFISLILLFTCLASYISSRCSTL